MNDAKMFLNSGGAVYYSVFVDKLIKKFPSNKPLEYLHAAMGVSGEAGELSDAIKRHILYGNPPNIGNIIEELGDLEFYMQDVRAKYNITRQQTLQANVAKLEKRYIGLAYSDEAAIARADKQVYAGADPEFTTDPDEV